MSGNESENGNANASARLNGSTPPTHHLNVDANENVDFRCPWQTYLLANRIYLYILLNY